MKISINNKEYGLQWGMGAIEIYCDLMGCELEGLDKIFIAGTPVQGKAITNLILAGIQNYCELYNESFDITYRKMQSVLDEMSEDVYQSIMKDWKKSKYFGRTIGEYYNLQTEPTETGTPKKKIKSRSAKS